MAIRKFSVYYLLIAILYLTIRCSGQSVWSYRCLSEEDDHNCKRVKKSELGDKEVVQSLDECRLTCNPGNILLPQPKEAIIGSNTKRFYPRNVVFLYSDSEFPSDVIRNMTSQAANIFTHNMHKLHPLHEGENEAPFPDPNINDTINDNILHVFFKIQEPTDRLGMETDESYTLTTTDAIFEARISSVTYFGARHALETLSQLIVYDELNDCLLISSNATIVDAPYYNHRGLHLDTSRNFYPVAKIKHIIEGLCADKLNRLHWHLTDSQSFPMYVTRYPQMSQYGAYSQSKVYSTKDIGEIVEFARIRGVKVVPELDTPAHSGHGWNWGPEFGMGNLTVCTDREPWYDYCVQPTCGQLNPANPDMYTVLGAIYQDMCSMFDDDLFHMGGDEVDLRCYNTTPEVTNWMTQNGIERNEEGFMKVWSDFQNQAFTKLTTANQDQEMTAILWTSRLTDAPYLHYVDKSKYVVQIWSWSDYEGIKDLIEGGYRVIFSNVDALYLDCGFGGWIGEGPNNWCSPYKGWQQIYQNDPMAILARWNLTDEAIANKLVLGGEVALWAEQVDASSSEAKIWPRASALSERLWSNPTSGWDAAEYRMLVHRERLVKRGIQADGFQPEWCNQNEDGCYGYPPDPPPPTTTEGPTPIPTEGPTTGPTPIPTDGPTTGPTTGPTAGPTTVPSTTGPTDSPDHGCFVGASITTIVLMLIIVQLTFN